MLIPLFEDLSCVKYFTELKNEMKLKVKSIKDEDILTCDFKEWIEYLYSVYMLNPIVLQKSNVSPSSITEQSVLIKTGERSHDNKEIYHEVSGYCINYKVYFDGNPDLLCLFPRVRNSSREYFSCADLINPKDNKPGYFIIKLLFGETELSDDDTALQKINDKFNNMFKDYKTMIADINAEVEDYNAGLKAFAEELLESHRKAAAKFVKLQQALEIPLNVNSSAPNAKPVPLRRIKRTSPPKPNAVPLPDKYCISDWDYTNINNIILMAGTTMEKTARTYYRNNEEELRDHLLASLNTHYDNATGETFRKLGKADISIELDNTAAFIGECKVWHGIKQFEEAIQQLNNYSTWRDTKVSLIIFNKNTKTFLGILDKIEDWVKENTKSHERQKQNSWNCKYYRADSQTEILLNILVFDLYVDETQFKDSRK